MDRRNFKCWKFEKLMCQKDAHRTIFKKIFYYVFGFSDLRCSMQSLLLWSTGSLLWRTDVSLVVAPGSAMVSSVAAVVWAWCPHHMGLWLADQGSNPSPALEGGFPTHWTTRGIPQQLLNSHILGKKGYEN